MTEEERQQHYFATLAVVVEELEEVEAKLRRVGDRYRALVMARNGLARLAGRMDMVMDSEQMLVLTTPEMRNIVRRQVEGNRRER